MEEERRITVDKIAFWLLCIIMFDCTALGGGTLVELFGIDLRMILFACFNGVYGNGEQFHNGRRSFKKCK